MVANSKVVSASERAARGRREAAAATEKAGVRGNRGVKRESSGGGQPPTKRLFNPGEVLTSEDIQVQSLPSQCHHYSIFLCVSPYGDPDAY